ncbi:MAG: CoA transferase [Dehalococcoidia bacterium]|nr:CoA transferase [Dehalococcoidia bacterium]
MPDRALEGLTVVECGVAGAAAYGAKLMADLGADVIKVEAPGGGDPSRALGPFPGGRPHPEKSGAFLYLNCNKQGVTLDLGRPRAQELLMRLLGRADVLIHDFPPRQAGALGLVYDRIREANPRLVMTSISPFGQDGPHRDFMAYDLTVASAGGWTWINGWPGHPEMPPLKAYGRQTAYQSGVTAAMATMGALFARLRTGRGQHIDVSAQECIASILEMTYTYWPYMETMAVRWGQRPLQPVDFFQCKDGGWVFALCIEEHQWQALVELMETPEWTTWEVAANRFVRASNWDALRPFMEEWVSQWTVDELYRAAQARRIPFAPASTLADLLHSPHLQARGFFVEVAYPQAGTLKQAGAPYKLGGTPWEIRAPAPALGQHSQAVFGGLLGLSAAELAALREEGVV